MKELPQYVLGKIVSLFLKNKKKEVYYHKGIKTDRFIIKHDSNINGVSLYDIYVPYNSSIRTLEHEYGHCLQSKKYKWFYLLIVGIPSLFGNIYDRLFHKKWSRERRIKWYFSRFPEKQADILGGVKRW